MNNALIFAGGSGTRMNSKGRPKQFLQFYGKELIIHTLENFQNHPEIDNIVVVCIEDWIPYLEKILVKFGIDKVRKIVSGGSTGQESIYKGVLAVKEISKGKDIILVHDGVTNPNFFEFYIQPQEVTGGSATPTCYHVAFGT